MDTILSKYISDGKISIDAINWTWLNELHTKEEIRDAMKEEILSGNIVLPMKDITIEDAANSFEFLRQHKPSELFGSMYGRYEYEAFPIETGFYYDEPTSGNNASDYFQQANRYVCGSINEPSPTRTWASSKFLDSMLGALWTLKPQKVDSGTLRTCLAMRKYVASQFKPTVAKAIYERFNARDVLDFSAGWGDRLCGFYACENTRNYIGIDPNAAVHDGYQKQIEFYETYTHKDTNLICKPAEDVTLPEKCVDLVFTSPPYFNIERYSDDDTQSFKRYRKLDAWLDGFLYRAVDLSCRSLKDGGYLCINISDVYSGHKVCHICDPMNQYIQKKKMRYRGVIGMRMAKRPNSKATQSEGAFIEPIWVWQKVG